MFFKSRVIVKFNLSQWKFNCNNINNLLFFKRNISFFKNYYDNYTPPPLQFLKLSSIQFSVFYYEIQIQKLYLKNKKFKNALKLEIISFFFFLIVPHIFSIIFIIKLNDELLSPQFSLLNFKSFFVCTSNFKDKKLFFLGGGREDIM